MRTFQARMLPLVKADNDTANPVYTGPKGGKYADPDLTIPWHEKKGRKRAQPKPSAKPRRRRPKSAVHRIAAKVVFHAMRAVQHAMQGALDVARGAIEGAKDALKEDEADGAAEQSGSKVDPHAKTIALPPEIAKHIDTEVFKAASEQLSEMHASAPAHHKAVIEATHKVLADAHAANAQAHAQKQHERAQTAAGVNPFEAPGVGHPGAMHLELPKPADTVRVNDLNVSPWLLTDEPIPSKPSKKPRARSGPKQSAADKQADARRFAQEKQRRAQAAKQKKQPPKPGKPARGGKATAPKAVRSASRGPAKAAKPTGRAKTATKPKTAAKAPVSRRVRKALLPYFVISKARKLHKRIKFRGLDISVENQKGSIRRWYDPHEKREGKTRMKFDYGYVRRTLGTDGDHVDVYVGPNEQASNVYVVTQMKAPDFIEHDEQKVMLGFDSIEQAERAYKAHYDDPRFMGEVRTLSFEDFARYVLDPNNHGELIKSSIVRPMRLVPMRKSPGVMGGSNAYGEGAGAGREPQPIPDMRVWQQPKNAESKKNERIANRRRRRAFAKWARGTLSLHGAPPDRVVRYEQQYTVPYAERGAQLTFANKRMKTPQIVSEPITKSGKGEERAGHKYISRKPDGKGGWIYDYGDQGGGRAPAAPENGHKPAPQTVQKPESASRAKIEMIDSIEGVRQFSREERRSPGRAKKRVWVANASMLGLPEDTQKANQEGGEYTAARKKLHDRIVAGFVDHVKSVPEDEKPLAIVTMGGSGAGKGSILKALVQDHGDFVVADPDACKEQIPEYQAAVHYGEREHDGAIVSSLTAAAMAHEESSDLADRCRRHAMANRKNLILDGTGKNTDKFTKRIEELKAAGYHVRLLMPHIPLSTAVDRARSRANGSGRYVPDEFVEEAHHVIPGNFERIARHAHEFALFDNRDGPRLVWSGGEGQEDQVHDQEFVRQFKRTGERRHKIARGRGWMKSLRFVIRRR